MIVLLRGFLTKAGAYIALALVSFLVILGLRKQAANAAVAEREVEVIKEEVKQVAEARDVVAKEIDETRTSDNRDILNRLRGRDSDWSGV